MPHLEFAHILCISLIFPEDSFTYPKQRETTSSEIAVPCSPGLLDRYHVGVAAGGMCKPAETIR